MPVYDFKCKGCGGVSLNQLVKYGEFIKCKCGKTMERCISAPNIGGMDKFGRTKK